MVKSQRSLAMADQLFVMGYLIGFMRKKLLKLGLLNGFHQTVNMSLSLASMILPFDSTQYHTTWTTINIQCLILDNCRLGIQSQEPQIP